MFCHNCGNSIPDGSTFCPNCGAQQETSPSSGTPAAQPKKKKRILLICIGVAVAVLVVSRLVSLLPGSRETEQATEVSTYETPLDSLVEFVETGSSSALKNVYPEKYIDAMLEYYDCDIDDLWEDMQAECRAEVGGNFSFSIDILEKQTLNSREISDLGDYFEDEFDMSGAEVTEGYLLKIVMTESGDKDVISVDEYIVVYKYQGRWYSDASSVYNVDSISELCDMW